MRSEIRTDSSNALAEPLPWLEDRRRSSFLNQYYSQLLTAAQVMIDFITVSGSFMLSFWIYTGLLDRVSPQDIRQFAPFSLGAALLYIAVMERMGLYRREVSLMNIKELRGIFHTAIAAGSTLLSVSFYLRSVSFSRLTVTGAITTVPLALILQRSLFHKMHLQFHQRGWSKHRILIFGAGKVGQHLAKRMFESPSLGLYPVGFLDDEGTKKGDVVRWHSEGRRAEIPILGGEEIIEISKKRWGIDRVIIALPRASFERNEKLVELCIKAGLSYAIVPNTYGSGYIQQVESFEIGGIPLLRHRGTVFRPYYLLGKRLIDFLLSGLLILLLSPLYFIIGLAIKIDSEGPIIFKQKRVGLRGREFSFYKFRSMRMDAPKYAPTPSSSTDPRITRVGRWIRRTSLDELPQLFNVLRSDMSLVGPRPEMPFIVSEYTLLERRRLEAKPGITGVWQISAVRGEPIHANIEYDLFYLDNCSFLLDFAILVKTFLSVIRGIGAF